MAGYARKGRLTVMVMALVLGFALPAVAGTVTIFGPVNYTRTEGAPNTYAATFSLPANVTDCQLLVSTASGGPLAANNVSVTVNGKEMVNAKKLRDTNPDTAVVQLQQTNTVFVTLKGKPGDSLTVQVVGVQSNPVPADPIPGDPIPGAPVPRDPIPSIGGIF